MNAALHPALRWTRRRARRRTRPIGVDLGATRVRAALVEEIEGRPQVCAVATRDHDGDTAGALREALQELRCDENRITVAITEPAGLVRTGTFPSAMGPAEREKAARFEATRYVDYPIAEAVLRLFPSGRPGEWVVGVARRGVLDGHAALAKRLKRRLYAVDHIAFALRRVLPEVDCIIDIGDAATTAYVFGSRIPIVARFEGGGRAFTHAIRDSLGIDLEGAERRKRTAGLAGAGEFTRDLLVDALASAFVDVRASGAADITGAALVGNGARLPGIAEAIERVTAVPTRIAALTPSISASIPADVLRAATPDWALAVGLALRETA